MEKSAKGFRCTAGAKGLPEFSLPEHFRTQAAANAAACRALRRAAYERMESGWTRDRCHARLPGVPVAFCGARIEESPNTQNIYSEQCGNCIKIVLGIAEHDYDCDADVVAINDVLKMALSDG